MAALTLGPSREKSAFQSHEAVLLARDSSPSHTLPQSILWFYLLKVRLVSIIMSAALALTDPLAMFSRSPRLTPADVAPPQNVNEKIESLKSAVVSIIAVRLRHLYTLLCT